MVSYGVSRSAFGDTRLDVGNETAVEADTDGVVVTVSVVVSMMVAVVVAVVMIGS